MYVCLYVCLMFAPSDNDNPRQLEDAKCVRRFLCEIATGNLKAPQFNPTLQV